MHAPRLVCLRDRLIHPGVPGLAGVRAWAGSDARLFLVGQGGWFGGRRWFEGDVVVCAGVAGEGALVVLEARGLGRPRLGSVRGRALHGEVGEVCSPARWGTAGEIACVVRPAACRQSCGVGDAEGVADPDLPGWRVIEVAVEGAAASVARAPAVRELPAPWRRATGPRPTPAQQLALFTARAAA